MIGGQCTDYLQMTCVMCVSSCMTMWHHNKSIMCVPPAAHTSHRPCPHIELQFNAERCPCPRLTLHCTQIDLGARATFKGTVLSLLIIITFQTLRLLICLTCKIFQFSSVTPPHFVDSADAGQRI